PARGDAAAAVPQLLGCGAGVAIAARAAIGTAAALRTAMGAAARAGALGGIRAGHGTSMAIVAVGENSNRITGPSSRGREPRRSAATTRRRWHWFVAGWDQACGWGILMVRQRCNRRLAGLDRTNPGVWRTGTNCFPGETKPAIRFAHRRSRTCKKSFRGRNQ